MLTKTKLLIVFPVFAILLTAPSYATAQVNNCLDCHQEWEDEDEGASYLAAHDVHQLNGINCVDCHGGDPTLEDMDEVRETSSYRGVPKHDEVPEFCARCHSDATYMRNHNPSLPTDQLAKYKTSIHGIRLLEHGDEKVADCVSCHTAHEIGSGSTPNSTTYPTNLPATCGHCHADAEYMDEYGIPTDQLADYKASVHGQALLERNDLGAPACNDCHSNHGAAPPGIASLDAVCGNCHAFEAEMFLDSPHKEAFAENDFPMCETCHSNHLIVAPSDEMVGTEEPAHCVDCHWADDGTRGFAVADSMSTALTRLVAARNDADSVLAEAVERGMHTTDEEFLMKEVEQTLIRTRSLVHSFDASTLVPEADTGIAKADSVRIQAASLVDNYYFRRQGLAIATLIITILAVLLYRRIRLIERKK